MDICIVGRGAQLWSSALIMTTYAPEHNYFVVDLGDANKKISTLTSFGALLQDCKITPEEFMANTKALPILGTRLVGWRSPKDWFDLSLAGSYTTNLTNYRIDVGPAICEYMGTSLNDCQPESILSGRNLTQFYTDSEGKLQQYFDFSSSFAFDEKDAVPYLKDTVIPNIFRPVYKQITSVNVKYGRVESVTFDDKEELSAHMFIDLDGVIGDALGKKHTKYTENFCVNRVAEFRVVEDYDETSPCVKAIAISCGWIHEVPTQSGTFRHVYFSNEHTTREELLKEISEVYNGSEIVAEDAEAFSTETIDKALVSNCLTAGDAAISVEPVTGLPMHVLYVQLREYCKSVLSTDLSVATNETVADDYNRKTDGLFNDVITYVSSLYQAPRNDSSFWVDSKRPTESAQRLVNLAKVRLLRPSDFLNYYHGMHGYSELGILLFGLGLIPKNTIERAFIDGKIAVEYHFNNIHAMNEKFVSVARENNFLTQSEIARYFNAS